MGIVVLNGKEFSDKESLLQDADFQALDDRTKSILLNSLDPNEPILEMPQNPVPRTVSPRQLRTALVLSGVNLSDIDNFINSLPEPNRSIAKIAWEYSVEIERKNPLLVQLAPSLGFTEKQLDELFILAETL